jgi:hypothetical protein
MAVSKTLRYQILRRDNNTCRTCGRSAHEVKLHVDHVVPEALGGRTEASNLQTLCADCNGGKSATPPDAAMVAEVSTDALRWADAQQVVVARMMAEMKSRTKIYNKVDKLWKEYGDVWRPADWRRSIDQFLDAGLPPEMVYRSAETALGKQRIRAGDCFKYMCGIAWSRISEIRDATTAAVAPLPPPPPAPDQDVRATLRSERHEAELRGWNQGRTELAEEVLGYYSADERSWFWQSGRARAVEEGDELDDSYDETDPYLMGRAAEEAFLSEWSARLSWESVGDRLLSNFSAEARRQAEIEIAETIALQSDPGDVWSEADLKRYVLTTLSRKAASASVGDRGGEG